MQIGVVIPVWRRARLVGECLEAVAVQDRPPAAVVVVDDGSDDGTAEAVEAFLRARPGWPGRLLRLAHGGAARARNRGLAALEGVSHVAFLDSDDLWPPDLLGRLAGAFGPGVVAASADRRREDLRRGRVRRDDLRGLARDPFAWLFRHGAGVGSCTLLDAGAVRAAGGYPEDLRTGEDMHLFLAVAEQGRWAHAPGAPVCFRHGHASAYGEADHVHRLHADALEVRAQLYERLGARYAHRLAPRTLRRARAWKWWRVALDLEQRGQAGRALEALARVRALRPWWLRAWRAQRRLRDLARRGSG